MARFLAADAFGLGGDELTLLPFNFERMGVDNFLFLTWSGISFD